MSTIDPPISFQNIKSAAPPAQAAPPTPAPASTAISVQQAAPPARAQTLELNQRGEIVHIGFDTVPGFEALQRIATGFSKSSLVPKAYQGNIANCAIAVEMALRMKASPLMVMQNLYIVHDNPSWSSKFLIASFNQVGRFTSIKYKWTGETGKPNRACQAWAKEKATGEILEGPVVSWDMVVAEGWNSKNGSKWKTMPDLMFMYRAAAFLVRTTAPELTMGLPAAEESEDSFNDDEQPPERRGGVNRLRQLAEADLDAADFGGGSGTAQ